MERFLRWKRIYNQHQCLHLNIYMQAICARVNVQQFRATLCVVENLRKETLLCRDEVPVWGGTERVWLALERVLRINFKKWFFKMSRFFFKGRAFICRGSDVSRYECQDNGVKMYWKCIESDGSWEKCRDIGVSR